jgi:hypothetical protein
VVDNLGVTALAADLGLIPPARLGPFVGLARRSLGLSADDLARQSDGRLSVRDVKLLERGRLACDEEQLDAIEQLLGVSFGTAAPSRTRLIVDPTQGRLVVGGAVTEMVPDASDEELLVRYLMLVYICRKVRPGSFIVPRADDVGVLAGVLGKRPADVRQSLARLPREERDALRSGVRQLSRRRLLPGLGLFVGARHDGALLLVETDEVNTMPAAPCPQQTTSATVLHLPSKLTPDVD